MSEPNPRARRLPPLLSRRQVLGRLAGLGAVLSLPGRGRVLAAPPAPLTAPDPTDALRPEIRPRSDWAGDLAPTGPIEPEDDVRFLLVHHTASTNDYGPDAVADQIRDFYQFHTGPEKGWPDVAYNFFVDRFGGIWEGRAGSLAGAVRGDATGGSQGFSQLCSLIGNHQEVPVSAEQQASLTRLLAWLGQRHGIDTAPGAEVSFVSRGSNRWPAGTEVTARTISGHRDMSQTSCPGDLAYALIDTELPTAVQALRTAVPAATTTTTAPTTTAPPATTAPTTTAAPTTAAPPTGSTLGSEVAIGPEVGPSVDGGGRDRTGWLVAGGVGAGALAAVGALVARLRRRDLDLDDPPDHWFPADED